MHSSFLLGQFFDAILFSIPSLSVISDLCLYSIDVPRSIRLIYHSDVCVLSLMRTLQNLAY